jgi:hypothetical protein
MRAEARKELIVALVVISTPPTLHFTNLQVHYPVSTATSDDVIMPCSRLPGLFAARALALVQAAAPDR